MAFFGGVLVGVDFEVSKIQTVLSLCSLIPICRSGCKFSTTAPTPLPAPKLPALDLLSETISPHSALLSMCYLDHGVFS